MSTPNILITLGAWRIRRYQYTANYPVNRTNNAFCIEHKCQDLRLREWKSHNWLLIDRDRACSWCGTRPLEGIQMMFWFLWEESLNNT
jgi:hypothetical protein